MNSLTAIIGYPLGWIMWLAYQACHNYAWSIVIFTLIVKMLLFPINVKTQKNSAAMAAFSPKLEVLKKKYANNPQKLQEAQMELYAEENINPMSSCLPMIIQLIIVYGVLDVVYRPITHIFRFGEDVVNEAIEICRGITEYSSLSGFESRPELYVLQAVKNPEYASLFQSLSGDFFDKVSAFDNTLFGIIDLGQIPSLHPEVWNAAAVGLAIIPFASGIFQLIMSIYSSHRQKVMNPEASKQMGSMNAMFYIMPIFSIWFTFSFPAGVGFYWAVSSLFSLISTIILNKIYTPEYVAKLIEKDKTKKKKKKKSSMMERYRNMMAEQNGNAQPVRKTVSGKVSDDDSNDIVMSKSKQKDIERKLISENRKKLDEKYKEDFGDLSEEEIKLIEEARIRQAEKYGES